MNTKSFELSENNQFIKDIFISKINDFKKVKCKNHLDANLYSMLKIEQQAENKFKISYNNIYCCAEFNTECNQQWMDLNP